MTKKCGRGFSVDNLEAMRRFYLLYKNKISDTVSRKLSIEEKSDTVSRILKNPRISKDFLLSWSHYRLLLRID